MPLPNPYTKQCSDIEIFIELILNLPQSTAVLIALCIEWPLSKISFINEHKFVDVVYIHIIRKPLGSLWLSHYRALE